MLKFKKTLTEELAGKAKALFQDNNEVAAAIDEALSRQQSGSDDAKAEVDNDGDDLS
ncbi:MAG TPA: hypothetical protein VMM36_08785 [Opitutaceae bacterium]|nr:hypothetical protein [Opitutaceae bacterium]